MTYTTFWVWKVCLVFRFLEKLRLWRQTRIKQIHVAKFHENLFSFSRVLGRLTCSHITYTIFWVWKVCFVFWFLENPRLWRHIWIKQILVYKFHEILLSFPRVLGRLTCSHITYTTSWVYACAWDEMTAVYEDAYLWVMSVWGKHLSLTWGHIEEWNQFSIFREPLSGTAINLSW
jgi:hypothetical protein